MGTVVTFYSYKGGVGRSFALANVATLLGRWGFRVLCVDWDIEAPGLEDFFRPYLDANENKQAPGLVELLARFARTRQVPLEWRPYLLTLAGQGIRGVDLIKAGRATPDYMRRVQSLNWSALYKKGLGEALETMFDEMRMEYDFILIDARTGVTDFSGIVTAQLPDILAFLFTANEQSLEGATSVARRAAAIRNDIATDRSRLLTLPIPARFENQVEHDISSKWRTKFAAALPEFYDGWASRDISTEKLVLASTIPYVPYWSFGERISAIEDSNYDTSSINYNLENIAALIAHKLGQTRLLIDSRDEYVGSARRLVGFEGPAVFISYTKGSEHTARVVEKRLLSNGIAVLTPDSAPMGVSLQDALRESISRATHFVMIVGRTGPHTRSVSEDARTFLRQAAIDEKERIFLPFVSVDVPPSEIPPLVRQFLYRDFDQPEALAEEVLRRIRIDSGKPADTDLLYFSVSSDGDTPVEDAQICALADNGTTVETRTDHASRAQLKLAPGRSYQFLIAHPDFLSTIIADFELGRTQRVRLRRFKHTGSVIVQSIGFIPGLQGRLNPILDTLDRTYLYADNIAINGGKRQPTEFKLDQSLILEDSAGKSFRVYVRLIQGRTTLLDYEPLP
ncbi:KGGVGR-motif variant AAA ATPase [Rhizobium sp. Rhizsp82]|uniref:KGGVGR-motif variant AAA ATPase n=1 Tax=Rhizobium sp. Rhizsp82 TaxID=3243057 RepID=UPI0039B53B54